MYMDIREYKENYHRIKEIYNTVASPMDAVQQIIQEFGRSDTEKIFAIAAQVLFPDGLIIEEDRRYLKRTPGYLGSCSELLPVVAQIHPVHIHNLIQALESIPREIPESWIKTDDLQYVKRTGENTFDLVEARYLMDDIYWICYGSQNVSDYFKHGKITKEGFALLSSYYQDLDFFQESYPKVEDQKQVLAECLFEDTVPSELEDYYPEKKRYVEERLVQYMIHRP